MIDAAIETRVFERTYMFSTQVYTTDEAPFPRCEGQSCSLESSIILYMARNANYSGGFEKKSLLIAHYNTTYVKVPIRINYEAD